MSTGQSQSFFLRMISQEHTRRIGYVRNNDVQVAQIQFPVGWVFFSPANVDMLIARLKQKVIGIDWSYLCPIMEYVYNSRGPLLEQDSHKTLETCLAILNDVVWARTINIVSGATKAHMQSVNVFYGRNMRSYDMPLSEPSMRVQNKRSHVIGVPDPAADPTNMFAGKTGQ